MKKLCILLLILNTGCAAGTAWKIGDTSHASYSELNCDGYKHYRGTEWER